MPSNSVEKISPRTINVNAITSTNIAKSKAAGVDVKQFDSSWFKECLIRVGKSQAELGRYLDWDKATVHHMLNGRRRLQLEDLEPLADFFEVRVATVLKAAGITIVTEGRGVDDLNGAGNGGFLSSADHLEGRQELIKSIAEVDVRGGMGSGGEAISVNHSGLPKDAVRDTWALPDGYVHNELHVSQDAAKIIEVHGDSMEPTLRSGDRVMVNTADRAPSPPGLFAIWDGIGIAVKRIEPVIGQGLLRIISDNAMHSTAEMAADEITLIGRVVWLARRV